MTTADKVALQATMAQYIDQHMVGDAFLHVDTTTGTIEKLYPANQHTMIVRLNQGSSCAPTCAPRTAKW